MKWIREIGPGILIAAAFIGPGTVTLCTIAGVSYGYSLIWALILSIFATIFLQELSLRVGLVTNMNVAEVISKSIKSIYFNKFLMNFFNFAFQNFTKKIYKEINFLLWSSPIFS